jgi:hypothetical protein
VPRWLRIARVGNTVTLYQSANGTAWTQAGSAQTLANLPPTVGVGMILASGSTAAGGASAYVRFDNVDLVIHPLGEVGTLSATSGSQAGQINLSWGGAIGAATHGLERSLAPGSGFAPIADLPAPATSFTDTQLEPATTYYYRVRASNDLRTSAYSVIASAQPFLPVGLEGWRYLNFRSTNSADSTAGDLADPNHDGLANLVAYATGVSPLGSTSAGAKPHLGWWLSGGGERYLTLSFSSALGATDANLVVERAAALDGPWQAINPFLPANQLSVTPGVPGPGLQTIVVKDLLPMGEDSAGYLRLNVTRSNP